jgi:phage FluMu protein Com
MSTLECRSCGARYHTAASGWHLEIVALTFRCPRCSSDKPMRIVTSATTAATERRPSSSM